MKFKLRHYIGALFVIGVAAGTVWLGFRPDTVKQEPLPTELPDIIITDAEVRVADDLAPEGYVDFEVTLTVKNLGTWPLYDYYVFDYTSTQYALDKNIYDDRYPFINITQEKILPGKGRKIVFTDKFIESMDMIRFAVNYNQDLQTCSFVTFNNDILRESDYTNNYYEIKLAEALKD